MKKQIKNAIISEQDGLVFQKGMNKWIDEYQSEGLEVEVKYSPVIDINGKIWFTALITGYIYTFE